MSAPAIPPCRYAVPAELIHDLRTPLGQIIGYSEMLAEQAREGGHDALLPELLKVGAAGWRLLELLEANFVTIPAPAPRAGNGVAHLAEPEAGPEDRDMGRPAHQARFGANGSAPSAG